MRRLLSWINRAFIRRQARMLMALHAASVADLDKRRQDLRDREDELRREGELLRGTRARIRSRWAKRQREIDAQKPRPRLIKPIPPGMLPMRRREGA